MSVVSVVTGASPQVPVLLSPARPLRLPRCARRSLRFHAGWGCPRAGCGAGPGPPRSCPSPSSSMWWLQRPSLPSAPGGFSWGPQSPSNQASGTKAQSWAVQGWGSLSPVLTPLSTSGTPASLRLQTRGVQPPTRLHSWSCSLGRGAQDTQQLHPQHPSPRTSSRGAPSPLPTPALGLTWMWAPNQCTELSLGPSASPPGFHHRPPLPFPQACGPITSTGPIPHTKWLPGASPTTPLHTLISLPPTLASKPWLSCWESRWGQLPLPGSHLRVNAGRLCLAKWGHCPALPPPGPHPPAPQVLPPRPSAGHTSLFSGPEYFC